MRKWIFNPLIMIVEGVAALVIDAVLQYAVAGQGTDDSARLAANLASVLLGVTGIGFIVVGIVRTIAWAARRVGGPQKPADKKDK